MLILGRVSALWGGSHGWLHAPYPNCERKVFVLCAPVEADGSCFHLPKTSAAYSHSGFMGITHAMSAVAVVALVLALRPSIVLALFDSASLLAVVATVLAIAGACMIPDLDNTSSRAKSDLGPVGSVLSGIFRVSSTLVQSAFATKYDRRGEWWPNPHRGLWHTPFMAVVSGVLVRLLVGIGAPVSLGRFGETTVGEVVALVVLSLMLHLALSSVFKPFMDKFKRGFGVAGDLVALALSVALSFSVLSSVSGSVGVGWVAFALCAGMVVHDLGDSFTTYGCPLLFPFPFRGKRWYAFRLSRIKAGGELETRLLQPLFTVAAVVFGLVALWRVAAVS